MVRLTANEVAAIRDAARDLDPEARVFLFGSRTVAHAKGGDIDLLIESRRLGFQQKIEFLVAVKNRIGEQKIDVVITPSIAASQDPFIRSIADAAVELV